ncbi:MAG TPA: hypothetical protein VG652_06725 [Gaiellaceae bacterium]|nr:hypothetical protein [Gaiellaceae bacterium]
MVRASALLGLAAAVGLYYATVSHLHAASLWWEVAWLAFVVIPAVFALVGLALPLASLPVVQLLGAAVGSLGLTLLFGALSWHIPANFGKLATLTFLAWAFLWLFEELSWVVIVACLIPWVDAYSVWRGPTKAIVNHHAAVFSTFSFIFPLPDGNTHLGLPDLYFYALFLAAAARFGLRVLPTWFALTFSFGATMALAIWWGASGLPALPLLSVGFLAPNADLLWARLRTTSVRAA